MAARIAVLTVLAALCICGSARASSPLTPFAAAEDAPLSDGGRWAVIPVQGGMLVLDGRDASLTPRPVPLAVPCGGQFGIPRGIGSGLVVIDCSFIIGRPHPRVLVYDLAARTFADAAGTENLQGDDGSLLTGVGRVWISFGSGATSMLLDWRTGRAIPAPRVAKGRAVDLDAASGSRPACSSISLRRRAWMLERCGKRSLTLARGGRTTRGFSVGDRAVAWLAGSAIHARALRAGGARKRWRAPGGKPVVGLVEVGRHLLVTVQGGPLGGARGFSFTVYRGRLP